MSSHYKNLLLKSSTNSPLQKDTAVVPEIIHAPPNPQAELSVDILPVPTALRTRGQEETNRPYAAEACKESLALTGIGFEVKRCISARKLPRKTASRGESSSFEEIDSRSRRGTFP
jgi:hypothetical protein